MAKNFLKNIFNQTKNNITKKKSIIDSQKLSDIIIINNNESNYFQQKPCDKFNILSNYYPKKEKKNKKEHNFLDIINELNNKFHISQEKYSLVKSSLDKLNDDLFSNLLKQIDCYIEEIQRLNKKLVIINNDNKEEVIQKLNKKILENEKTIRNYKHKLRENANKEEKLNKEIEYYKKRLIFYKNKININLISRKISYENDEKKEREQKNNIHSGMKLYNNISNNLAKPRYSKIKNDYFNQSTGKIIQIRSDRKLLTSTDFSGNKNSIIRNKLLSKERTIFENENPVSDFLSDKESKDGSNNNLIHVKNNTVIENFNFSNDSSDNINEQNNSENLDICENLNINANINKLNSNQSMKRNKTNYPRHNKINSEIINKNKFNINESENKLNINNKMNDYINKDFKSNSNISNFSKNSIKHRNSTNISLDINSNKSFLEHKNSKSNFSFYNSKNISTSKNAQSKTISKHNTFYGTFNNQKSDKFNNDNTNQSKTMKSRNSNNKLKETQNENKNKKESNISKYKTIDKAKINTENNEKNKNKNKKILKSKSIKKDSNNINNKKKEEKKIEVDEKELKKVLKDINEDYNNDIEMLNNQENQIKFLLNLLDVNN
jgi:hypothetical protein